MNKVGILTFHYADNCGAILQLMALRDTINEMGYKAVILNYESTNLNKRNSIIRNPVISFGTGWKSVEKGFKRKMKRGLGETYHSFKMLFQFKELKEAQDAFAAFRKKHINSDLSESIKGIQDLERLSNSFTTIVVGSDQVWNIELLGGIDKVYFLDSANIPCRKISYAASAGGNMNMSGGECQEHLKNFDVISVRETQLADEIRKYMNAQIQVVADPVFLLKRDQWMDLIGDNNYGKYILLYPIEGNREMVKIVDYLRDFYKGSRIIEFSNVRLCDEATQITDGTPDTFLTLIYHAEYIVSNSFHATAFSCLFEKDFVTVRHSTRNMRMENLLNKLGMEQNMVSSLSEFKHNFSRGQKCNDNLSEKINDMREDALYFLSSNLC